jgi:hypothetical protein
MAQNKKYFCASFLSPQWLALHYQLQRLPVQNAKGKDTDFFSSITGRKNPSRHNCVVQEVSLV